MWLDVYKRQDITVLLALVCLVSLLIHDAAAVRTEQYLSLIHIFIRQGFCRNLIINARRARAIGATGRQTTVEQIR